MATQAAAFSCRAVSDTPLSAPRPQRNRQPSPLPTLGRALRSQAAMPIVSCNPEAKDPQIHVPTRIPKPGAIN